MTIGLIGYGRFGRLAAGVLARRANVVVWDPRLRRKGRLARRVLSTTLEEVARQPVVVLAVPVSALRELLTRVRSYVSPGALVLDVCAVKSVPLRWMSAALPPGVSIIGTHPFFGPDSYNGTLEGHRIVLCPVRAPRRLLMQVRRVLRESGLHVEIMTPDAHDRTMAETVFLTQFVGRLLAAARLAGTEGWTVHSRRLRSIVDVARNDSRELFLDMWKYNPHARAIVRRFGLGWRRLERLLNDHRTS